VATELEYKFTLEGDVPDIVAPDGAALEALLRPAGFGMEARPLRLQHDRYFDSRTGALELAGLALRLRSFGETRLVTLKRKGRGQDGLHRREELELPFTGDWPEGLREALRGLDPGSLEPVADLFAERRRFVITREERALAELSFDAVRAVRPGGGASAFFREVELEALTADAETPAHLAGVLQGGLRLSPNAVNKLERARALLEAEEGGEDG
jgi:inorganic triphosphatase YgiF